jgi:hypothetical protein
MPRPGHSDQPAEAGRPATTQPAQEASAAQQAPASQAEQQSQAVQPSSVAPLTPPEQSAPGPTMQRDAPGSPVPRAGDAGSSDSAGSQSAATAQPDESVTRSIWEPPGRDRSTPRVDPASGETIQYVGPSIKTGPSAWQTGAMRHPMSRLQHDAAALSSQADGPADVQPQASSGPAGDGDAKSVSGSGQDSPPRAEPRAGTGARTSFGAAQLQRQTQERSDGLPKRQPMTHLAAPLRRDRASAATQEQKQPGGGPMPSVWDTWRPTAGVRRTGQQDGSDSGDEQA